VCLPAESRARVDELVRQAVAAGGATYNEPQDHGVMDGHGFGDLDGHIWELIPMAPSAIHQGYQRHVRARRSIPQESWCCLVQNRPRASPLSRILAQRPHTTPVCRRGGLNTHHELAADGGTEVICCSVAPLQVWGGAAPAAEAWSAIRLVTGAADKEDHMSLAMTRQERETFLADVHVGIIRAVCNCLKGK
jgi:hypothetical protein